VVTGILVPSGSMAPSELLYTPEYLVYYFGLGTDPNTWFWSRKWHEQISTFLTNKQIKWSQYLKNNTLTVKIITTYLCWHAFLSRSNIFKPEVNCQLISYLEKRKHNMKMWHICHFLSGYMIVTRWKHLKALWRK